MHPVALGQGHALTRDQQRLFQLEDLGGKLAVGTKVEARFGGEADWFPGTITATDGDGTFGVLYDDGDSEEGVARSLISAYGAGRPSSGEMRTSFAGFLKKGSTKLKRKRRSWRW